MRHGVDEAFAALADPTRRGVVHLLRRGPRRVGDLAAALDTSAPAMSRHLRILRRTGVVEEGSLDEDARVRMYRLRREPFARLRHWLDDVETLWNDQVGSIAEAAPRAREKRRA